MCLADPGGGRGGAPSSPLQTRQLRGAARGEGRGQRDGGDGAGPSGDAPGAPLRHPAVAEAGAGSADDAVPPVHRDGNLLHFPGPASVKVQHDNGRQRHGDPRTVVDKRRHTRGAGVGHPQCTLHRGKNNPLLFCVFFFLAHEGLVLTKFTFECEGVVRIK